MRVIVIGAGLGGLALAHSLVRQGIDVAVYERDGDVAARFQGYRIGLLNRGVDDLRYCVPARLHPLLDAISGDVTGLGRAVDEQLVELGSTPPRDEGLLFDRDVLRHLLLADLADRVRFGRRLRSYAELPDGTVRADFADGTTATADLLVGADGMGSSVRRQLLPDVRILDLGVRGAIGRTILTERFADLVPGWTTMVLSGDLRLFIGKMPFRRPPHLAARELAPDVVLPATASYLRWVMLMPAGPGDVLPPTGTHAEDAVAAILHLVRDWHPDLRALFEESDRDNSGVGPLRTGPRVDPWPTSRVTLLGDSAHPMPPGGLGANLAFRDARLLSTTLARVRSGAEELLPALADYEREMCEYAAAARAEALATIPLPERAPAAP
jgi:2-polyprenyl-6-methoxyphenol hydroxylase-like FAD-dependent oxidoreductase